MKKKIIITGATSGIGLATFQALTKANKYEIILGVRNTTKAKSIIEEFAHTTEPPTINIYHLDLASLESIKNFSNKIYSNYDSIDILFNNAGLFSDKKNKTKEGFEMSMGVNFVGTYYLTMLLKDIVSKGNSSQIINVGSRASLLGKFEIKENCFCDQAHGIRGYSASKYLLMISSIYLAKDFDDMGISFNTIHPGVVATNIWRGNSTLMKIVGPIMKKTLHTIEKGAIAGLHLINNRPALSGGFYQMESVSIDFNKYDEEKAHKLIDYTNSILSQHGYTF